jgi:hypothetical protein
MVWHMSRAKTIQDVPIFLDSPNAAFHAPSRRQIA